MHGTLFFSLIDSNDCNDISIDLIISFRFSIIISRIAYLWGQTLDRKKSNFTSFFSSINKEKEIRSLH
jgi:hypothetical protein